MMKQIPYGLTDFARIQKDNYYYVDKTMFIERIEMQPAYLFLIRPRRFGKSLTLAMLEAYYDVVYANDFDELFGHLYIGQHPTPKHNCYLIMRFNFSEVSSNVNEVERSFKLHCCSKLRDFVFKYEIFWEKKFGMFSMKRYSKIRVLFYQLSILMLPVKEIYLFISLLMNMIILRIRFFRPMVQSIIKRRLMVKALFVDSLM